MICRIEVYSVLSRGTPCTLHLQPALHQLVSAESRVQRQLHTGRTPVSGRKWINHLFSSSEDGRGVVIRHGSFLCGEGGGVYVVLHLHMGVIPTTT